MKQLTAWTCRVLMMVAATSGGLVRSAAAAEQELPWAMATITKQAPPVLRLERANGLLGSDIYDPRGYTVGQVTQVLLGRDFERVAMVLVVSSKDPKVELPIPLTVFRRDAASRWTVDVVAADLFRVPKVDRGDWSELTHAGFLEKLDFFYKGNSRHYREAADVNEPPVLGALEDTGMIMPKASPYQKLSKLVGLDVRTRDAEMVGNLEDLVVDPADGKVVYGVVSLNQTGHDEMLVIVPWTAIGVRPRQVIARVDATLETLQALAFEPMRFPDLMDRALMSRIFQTFGREPYWQVYGYAPRVSDRKAAWRAGSAFNRAYDAKKLKTYIGLVDSVGTFVPENGAADGVRVRVRNEQGDFLIVLLAPRAWVERMGLELKQGSDVLLTGAEAQWEGKTVILAVEVQTAGQTYRLRDADGQPLWRTADIE